MPKFLHPWYLTLIAGLSVYVALGAHYRFAKLLIHTGTRYLPDSAMVLLPPLLLLACGIGLFMRKRWVAIGYVVYAGIVTLGTMFMYYGLFFMPRRFPSDRFDDTLISMADQKAVWMLATWTAAIVVWRHFRGRHPSRASTETVAWRSARSGRLMEDNPYKTPSAPLEAAVPSVDKAILNKIRTAWIAGLVSASFTLIYIGIYFARGKSIFGIDEYAFMDVGIMLCLTYGVYKKSRACAVLLLAYFFFSKIIVWMDSGKLDSPLIAFLFVCLFWQGVEGTFKYRKARLG